MSSPETSLEQEPKVPKDSLTRIAREIQEQIVDTPIVLVEVIHGEPRLNPDSIDDNLVVVICPSIEIAKELKNVYPKTNSIITVADPNSLPLAAGSTSFLVDPHKYSQRTDTEQHVDRTILRKIIDFGQEITAAIVSPIQLIGIRNPSDVEYKIDEAIHDIMKRNVINALKERQRVMKQEQPILVSMSFVPPGTEEPLGRAKEAQVGEFTASNWNEVLEIFNKGGFEIETVSFGMGIRNRFIRILGAGEVILVAILAKMGKRTIEEQIEKLSMRLVPALHAPIEGLREIKSYTPAQINQLIKDGIFTKKIKRPDRIIITARKKIN